MRGGREAGGDDVLAEGRRKSRGGRRKKVIKGELGRETKGRNRKGEIEEEGEVSRGK